jgi:hypothetical protein
MKVLDLQCQHAHSFEGWFGSEDDFQSQLGRGLVECPFCGNVTITKKLSAPRLNLSASRAMTAAHEATDSVAGRAASTEADSSESAEDPAKDQTKDPVMQAMLQDPQFQAAYLHMARKIMANTEDVGNQFAEEARKIHYGEAKERGIRGQASHDERMELLEEGIDVMPLPLPKALKEPLQ